MLNGDWDLSFHNTPLFHFKQLYVKNILVADMQTKIRLIPAVVQYEYY